MKNPDLEIDDLRPEYRRTDFAEMVRGRYGATQVEFGELVHLLLSCIAEDSDLDFTLHHVGNFGANRQFGEWTYEFGIGNQITLRYWLDSFRSIQVHVTNPPCVTDPKERAELNDSLMAGVQSLTGKVREYQMKNG